MLHTFDTRGWDKNIAYCVPTSISFLTGIPLIHSHSRAAMIQDVKMKDVKGVYTAEALLMLREQGYTGEKIKLSERYNDAPTLIRFMKDRTSYEKCMPLMIAIEDAKNFSHMISAHYNYIADNHTMKPVPYTEYKFRNKYVTEAWIIGKTRKSS
jgi:hypothetical protein